MAAVPDDSTDGLRRQLLAARKKLQEQIDKLRARPDPLAGIGPVGTNGATLDNEELITRLTETLRDIDDCIAGLRANR